MVLSLYRDALWHAKRFPSIKRAAILDDIRAGMLCGERASGVRRSARGVARSLTASPVPARPTQNSGTARR